MKTLVYIEHEGGEVRDATLSAVTAAVKLGAPNRHVAVAEARRHGWI